jgi:hypothetical protein
MRRTVSIAALVLVGLTLGTIGSANAAIVGYWRMEVDNDAGTGVSVPNEVAGGSPFITGAATGQLSATSPSATVPQTGAANLSSIDSNGDLLGSIASYTALNTNSITIEFWARTGETTATIFNRFSATGGIQIDNANALRAQYRIDDGAGGNTLVTLTSSPAIDLDATTWTHAAFTYDALTGVGSWYRNGVLVNSIDGPDNRNLVWVGTGNIAIGADMDATAVTGGILDELRISDVALPASQLLASTPTAVPEPSSVALAGLGCLSLLVLRRRRRS